jgi:hypothetical protein
MTDEEMKRLEDLVHRAEDKKCGGYWPDDLRNLHGSLWPKDVLALIERVRKAEARVKALEGSTLGQALRDAERKGALEMRDAVVRRIQEKNPGPNSTWLDPIHVARTTPLPGDPP